MENESLLNLRRFVIPEFIYGQGAINLTSRHIRNFGAKKVMLVTDPGIIQAGWVKKVEENLIQEGIQYVLFKDVTPNPKDYEVMAGVKTFSENGCDIIVAIGGGSPLDCAKGIGIVSTNNKHILEFEGVDEVPIPGPPLICIPTTAGTSADISQFAIIVDSSRKVKIAIISKTVIPDVSLIDPETTTTMPTELTAATGIDAFVHACEAYVSNLSFPITDLAALEAIRLINENLIHALNNPMDMKYRNNMMMASLLAGMAFSNASLGLVHSMAHSLGGLLGLAHGVCNAVLLEYVIDFNFEASVEKYTNISEALNLDMKMQNTREKKSLLLNKIAQLRKDAGINITLGELGVGKKDLDQLAKNAIEDPCLATNPRKPKLEDIKAIYERAL
ncbi:MAG: iron-containing alcohol dehydrogenase [Bacteroidetes bacterium]|nr:iron-containing alcohol dehydrogenase [Bacteroidota bacterium]MBU1114670.1 iron-containing alcohol dehydrogenase [Bacteroidota bacterium]MBU1798984.1 iron-containing alcohol dehydrogenase [Bacteroidota bacterium]